MEFHGKRYYMNRVKAAEEKAEAAGRELEGCRAAYDRLLGILTQREQRIMELTDQLSGRESRIIELQDELARLEKQHEDPDAARKEKKKAEQWDNLLNYGGAAAEVKDE